MDSKVALICVYFGKLPKWFNLWLKSCEYNDEYRWILFTDDLSEYDFPANVRRVKSNISTINNLIKEKMNIDFDLKEPYKLCDFKVAYGIIFSDYLKEFTHWGYCDLDMIFGDLSQFISDDILLNYDRIFCKGHLTIYKNNSIVNNYFKLDYSGVNYKVIFESKYHYGFDEIAGMDKIYEENDIPYYMPNKINIADINSSSYQFRVNYRENYKKQCFIWQNGHVYRKYKKNNKEGFDEFAYIHFQKRNLSVQNIVGNRFIISPIGILNISESDDVYFNNRNIFSRQLIRKLDHYKRMIKQKIYRFIHWKLNL